MTSDLKIPNPDEVGDIYSAINAVMMQVGYVLKEGAPGLAYKYAGEAALIAAVRPHFVRYGIVTSIQKIELLSRETSQTIGEKPKLMFNTMLHGVVEFRHVRSGTFFQVNVIGEGSDFMDKGSPKAMTGILKYALRQVLLIETGDDPDKVPSVATQEAEELKSLHLEIKDALQNVGGKDNPEAIAILHKYTYGKNNWKVINDPEKAQELIDELTLLKTTKS